MSRPLKLQIVERARALIDAGGGSRPQHHKRTSCASEPHQLTWVAIAKTQIQLVVRNP
jgi:hypothetical protein